MIPFNPQGLSPQEVETSRTLHGSNIITPTEDHAAWQLFKEKFNDPIIRILIVAALLSLGIGIIHNDFTEAIGIIAAIILATCVSFWFEWDAERRFRSLNKVNDDVAVKVVRQGVICSIRRCEVVVGDQVIIETGETIPADGELIEAVSLKINESTLTGELEVDKTCSEEAFDQEATYPSNQVMRGTTVMDGYGRMIVTAVGDNSEAGRVTEQATVRNDEATPLDEQLKQLAKWVGRMGMGIALLIFVMLLVKGFVWGSLLEQSWYEILQYLLQTLMLSLAIIVMAVPEGLPMSITLSLAMSMRRMLKTNNLVRKMHACETMGAVTVICTDKTGTLTQNRMSVQALEPIGSVSTECLAQMMAANSTAFLDPKKNVLGNPTEGALLLWIEQQGFDYETLRLQIRLLDRITFSTERKFMATLYEDPSTNERILTVKGAPEIVRKMAHPTANDDQITAQLNSYQQRAMRTLAIASTTTTAHTCQEALNETKLDLAAIVAISDPVRKEVPEAVRHCLDAGISIKVVTGDTDATAREIARQIGLWDDAQDTDRNALSGADFAAMSDEELLERVGDLKLLSRAKPLDKQRLVKLLQRRGEVVAVTGDGTNDAPALNFAHVGLSMGSGTSVAKDASDITLLDDSFRSIVTAVMWGRSLYRNIQRFVLFQLTVNFVAISVCLIGTLFGTDMPLTVVQILWVNIIMDTFAAMAMASLPPQAEVMEEKPRKREAFIITPKMRRAILYPGIVMVVILLFLLFRWDNAAGDLTQHGLTKFFTVFVFFQFWNMFNAKGYATHHTAIFSGKGCREFFFILMLIAVGQILIVELGGELFRTNGLSLREWAWIISLTSILAFGGDLIRILKHRQ